MKTIHGGKAKTDKIDAGKLAALLRGGLFPMAYAYPRAKRQTRDLLRRRSFFGRQGATVPPCTDSWCHGTFAPSHLRTFAPSHLRNSQ